MTLKVLFFGDIVGEVGCKALLLSLSSLRKRHEADFVIANEENADDGRGLSQEQYLALKKAGVDCVTLGNHYRSNREIDGWIDQYDDIVRPMNVLSYHHGEGSRSFSVKGETVRVSAYLGEAFMKEKVENPFLSVKRSLANRQREVHIIDFHADSTSEKRIFAESVKGQASAVIGTHTHVQTADQCILEGGTAFLSDVGFCGYKDGVIGYTLESVLPNFLEDRRTSFHTPEKGKVVLSYCLLEIDAESKETLSIATFMENVEVN